MYNRENQSGAMTRRPEESLSRQRGGDWFTLRDPWQEMQDMHRRMDQLFSQAFGQGWPFFSAPMGQTMNQMSQSGVVEPDIDFTETDTEYAIRAALPGISPDDINVQATPDSIRLTAQTRSSWDEQQPQGAGSDDQKQAGSQTSAGKSGAQQPQGQRAQQQGQNATQHRQSQFSRINRFEFAYSLPEEINPNEVDANFKHGVLELRLPKKQPTNARNQSVTIPIQGTDQAQQISGTSSASAGSGASARTGAQTTEAEHQTGARSGADSTSGQNEPQSSDKKAAAGRSEAKSK